MIETWGFREDIKDVNAIGLMMMTPQKHTVQKQKFKFLNFGT